MGNFTESQILILALIATSNIILIIVAVILLFSGRKKDYTAPNKKEVANNNQTKAYEYREEPEEIKEEPIKEDIDYIKQVDSLDSYEDEIDYENYTVPNGEYSDEEYKYSSIEEFENAQEETAIISYKELLKLKNAENNKTPEPIHIEEPPKKVVKPKTYSNTNYGTGEFISPVFGRMDNSGYKYQKTEPTPIERKEKTRYNREPIRREEPKPNANTEFLNALKEFRNNL